MAKVRSNTTGAAWAFRLGNTMAAQHAQKQQYASEPDAGTELPSAAPRSMASTTSPLMCRWSDAAVWL
jgi:hypothetical protein